MTALLPCPFCGSKECVELGIGGTRVKCFSCGAKGPEAEDGDANAVTLWNTRPSADLTDEEKEALACFTGHHAATVDAARRSPDWVVKNGERLAACVHRLLAAQSKEVTP